MDDVIDVIITIWENLLEVDVRLHKMVLELKTTAVTLFLLPIT